MSRFTKVFAVLMMFGVLLGGFSTTAVAQQTRNERDVRETLKSLNSKIDDFRYSLRYGLRNSPVNESDAEFSENQMAALDARLKDFADNFAQRRENADDVESLLEAAKQVDDFVASNRVNDTVQRDWNAVRTLLDRLAANYNVRFNWSRGTTTRSTSPTNYPSTSNVRTGALVGTYQLDASKSEDPAEIVAGSGVQGDEQKQDLEDKLEAAEQIAIDVRGSQITLASSNAAPVSFTADGRTKNETVNGRTVRVRATLRGQELTVSTVGGETDYTVTFLSMDGGRSMKVTRRITTDYLDQTVFAESFYNKTDSYAKLDIDRNPASVDPNDRTDSDNDGTYSSNDPNDVPNSNPNAPTTSRARTGDFLVPNGTVVTGILENDITTKVSQNNDRFRLTVQAPNEYRGAVIEGFVTGINRSGKVSGNSKVTFNFETIRLRNGQTYEFAGFLQNITDTNGKVVKIDTEGTAKGDSQTKETVKRGGIGAGLGAIIGAIAGGGKGAIIGAVIGGGAGAGSVVVQGKDDLDLKKGSQISVTASAPNSR